MAKAFIRIETDQTAYYYPLNRPVVIITPTNALATITVDIDGNNVVTITDDGNEQAEIIQLQSQIAIINTEITNLNTDVTNLHNEILAISTVTVEMSIAGPPPGGQTYQVVFTQDGTLTTNGAQYSILTAPSNTNILTVQTINSGTIISQGSISIDNGGTTTFPDFFQAMDPGDALLITNQQNADPIGQDYAFGFVFVKNVA